MFQFTRLPRPSLCIQLGVIREPRDHNLFVSSPKIFADFHALHRLSTPRHPPCALSRLATEIPNSFPTRRTRKQRRRESRYSQLLNDITCVTLTPAARHPQKNYGQRSTLARNHVRTNFKESNSRLSSQPSVTTEVAPDRLDLIRDALKNLFSPSRFPLSPNHDSLMRDVKQRKHPSSVMLFSDANYQTTKLSKINSSPRLPIQTAG